MKATIVHKIIQTNPSTAVKATHTYTYTHSKAKQEGGIEHLTLSVFMAIVQEFFGRSVCVQAYSFARRIECDRKRQKNATAFLKAWPTLNSNKIIAQAFALYIHFFF